VPISPQVLGRFAAIGPLAQPGNVVEVAFEVAGREDVVDEDEDVVHVVGELPDQPNLLYGLGAGADGRSRARASKPVARSDQYLK
jgi:hypothetical protein